MKPREPRESGQHDMFRSRLDQILGMGHEKVILSDKIDWQFLSDRMGGVYTDGPGHPPLSNRLMAGLHILKYAEDLSAMACHSSSTVRALRSFAGEL